MLRYLAAAVLERPARWFAEHQPFPPVIETLRGLHMGTAIGNDALLAVCLCALIGLVRYRWAMRLYDLDPTRYVRLLSKPRRAVWPW